MGSDDQLPPDHQDFPDGSLLRVVFHNFLTYEHTSFLPTAHLNMILGHNGSGKSSIICGICLACGGSPKSLGRSEKIVEYIRHGCTEGYVEIAIADKAKGPQIVRLTIRVGKHPEYRLNGNVTTQNELIQLRKHYNIQIDNPCAFLAQDKVKSFSEQSSIELLRNTEKAASDELHNQHEELIEQRKDSSTIEEKCASAEKAIKNLEAEIAHLKPFVENYRKKLALQTKLRLLEKKLKFLEFDAASKDYQREVKKTDEAMVEYREVAAQIEESEGKAKKLVDRMKVEQQKIAKLKSTSDEYLSNVTNSVNKRHMEKALERSKANLESARHAAEKHEKDLEASRKAVEAAKSKLETAEEDVVGYEEFHTEQRSQEQKFADLERENRIEEDAMQKKAYQMKILQNKQHEENMEAKNNLEARIRAMHDISQDAAKAYRWYLANRQGFRGDVYVPVIDMILQSPEAAKALENSVNNRDRCMFVCTSREDEQRINGKDHSWRINSTVVPPEHVRQDTVDARVPPELARMGFKFLVSESFESPAPLKQYLCNVAGLARIPYGDAEVERRLGEVSGRLAETRYTVFMTNSIRVHISKSRYSGEVINSQSQMRDPYQWRDQCYRKSPFAKNNSEELNEQIYKLRQEIDARADQVAQKRQVIQRDRDILKVQQSEWKAKLAVKGRWKTELTAEVSKLRMLERETVDVAKAEREFEVAEKKATQETKKMFQEAVKWQKLYLEKYREIARRALIETMAKYKKNQLTLETAELREKLAELNDVKIAAETALKAALNRKKAASDSMKQACQLKHLDVKKMDPTEKAIFLKLTKMFEEAAVPTEIDPLEDEINSERTRLKLAEENGEDGSIEHEQKMERLKGELLDEQSKQEKLLENRKRIHDRLGADIDAWKEEVEKMIERINENYVKYFGVLGCRGEVSLEAPENALDIEKYGIMIMVCFRAGEKMKRLDNKVQSGGERSVATMLYLLALQQLCPVPFRCIDEINQGMDPTNERKVFDIMVGLWNGSDGALTKTQYFLLSPKLLHGLDMRENVNIVMVNSTLVDYHGKNFDTEAKLTASLARLQVKS